MEFISWALVFMGMFGCLKSGASWKMTLLAFCVHVSMPLSSLSSCVKMLPRYLNFSVCWSHVPLMSVPTLLCFLLTDMTSVLLMFICMPCSIYPLLRLVTCFCNYHLFSLMMPWSSARRQLIQHLHARVCFFGYMIHGDYKKKQQQYTSFSPLLSFQTTQSGNEGYGQNIHCLHTRH